MKRIFFVALLGTSVTTICTTSNAQIAFTKAQALDAAVNVSRNDVNVKALRHFVRNFNETSAEKWYATPELVVALFRFGDIDYRVDYNIRNGNWIETFRTYKEANMSAHLKEAVRSSYHEYTIFQVQEIEQPLHPLNYIVHLEGRARLINLRIYDGQMQEEQNFKQSQ